MVLSPTISSSRESSSVAVPVHSNLVAMKALTALETGSASITLITAPAIFSL
jgi:hypothetical protein